MVSIKALESMAYGYVRDGILARQDFRHKVILDNALKKGLIIYYSLMMAEADLEYRKELDDFCEIFKNKI